MKIQHTHLFFIGLLFSIYFSSCSELCEGECFEELDLSVRIIRATDSTDLLFGDDKLYDINAMNVFSISGSDTTFYTLDSIILGNPMIEGFLLIDHREFSMSRAFIDYGNSDIDTLDVQFFNLDCCTKKFNVLDSVAHNSTSIYSNSVNGGQAFITIRK